MQETSASKPLQGLTGRQAAESLKTHGPNQIEQEKGRSAWLLFAEQFRSPLVIILIFACVLSAFLGERLEAAAIGAILLLNALIGFFQEARAETAIAALQEMTSPRARVLREGHQALIMAHDVVPEDILLLEAGDIVAADAEILECSHFQVNEAVLTGESVPVRKETPAPSGEGVPQGTPLGERSGSVFMGTAVVTGTATARVDATGMKTELGKIAHLIASAQRGSTPLQVQLIQVGHSLLLLCLVVVFLVAGIGLIQGRPWAELLVFSISLAVAAVPEGLPAIVTVALALGVQRMAERNALIRKLPSVETLGSVSVICTDKTGTLTTGDMRVREIWGDDHERVLQSAASCCDAELGSGEDGGAGDPTELAILVAARERGIEKADIEKENPRRTSIPFDPERRLMSVSRRDGKIYVKGAFESLRPLCEPGGFNSQAAQRTVDEMSSRGLRVLAVAEGEGAEEKNLRFLGLLGIADPPRSEVFQAIKEARQAGILPIMITGDHPQTAVAIARELGLVLEGESVKERVHARATPEDKLQLVREWKKRGAVVAMTGDGVNDAPALREAHVGVAMGQAGTEVTRQAADLILGDDNFATIVAAIREGRGIFQNIRKAITYLLTGNFAEIVLVLGAIVLGLPTPLLATHLLWINLVTDALPGLTLVADPLPQGIMKIPPRPTSEKIMGRSEWVQIIWVGLLEAALMLSLYHHYLAEKGQEYARSFVFTAVVFSQMLRAFGARSSRRFFWEISPLTNLWLLAVVLLTGILQLSLHFIPFAQTVFGLHPLSLGEIGKILLFGLIPSFSLELKKGVVKWKERKRA